MQAHSDKSSEQTSDSRASSVKEQEGSTETKGFTDNRVNSIRQLQQQMNPLNAIQRMTLEEASGLKDVYDRAVEKGGDLDEAYASELASSDLSVDTDDCDHADDPVQAKMINSVAQLAHAGNTVSGPKSYGGHNNILFARDAQGNIDFSNPKQYHLGKAHPSGSQVTPGSLVDVGTSVGTYGTGNRYQHFKEANTKKPTFGGVNGSSPAGLTWHHLSSKHNMHLVDRQVHRKHGHNGGVHIW